jgi:hypothetical protein
MFFDIVIGKRVIVIEQKKNYSLVTTGHKSVFFLGE